MQGQQSKLLLMGIVALALGVRLTVAVLTTSWVFPSDDNFWAFGHEKGQIASSLAAGNGFSWPDARGYPPGPTSRMAPVYPLIMAGAFRLFGVFSQQAAMAIELFLSVVSALTCIPLFYLGKRLYNAQVGLLAALLLAVYPPSVYYSVHSLWDTSLFSCCFLLTILMFARSADRASAKEGAYLGGLMGFTALVNPVIIVAYPFASAWLYLQADADRKALIKTILSMLIAFCLVISPWVIRNYIVFGQLTLIKSNLGQVLFISAEKSIIAYGKSDDKIDNFTESEREIVFQADEVSRDGFLHSKALSLIVDHPIQFMQRIMNQSVRFWTIMRPVNKFGSIISLAIYLFVLALAVFGLVFSKIKDRNIQLTLIFLLTLPVPYYMTFVHIYRYRYPIEPLLIVFASFTIHWLGVRLFSRDLGRSTMDATAAVH